MALTNGEDHAQQRLATLLAGRDLDRLTAGQRAMLAARLANGRRGQQGGGPTIISSLQAAEMVGLSVTMVREARRFLAAHKPEDVARVEAGTATMHTVNKGHADQQALRRGQHASRIEKMRLNAAIWQSLKAGLLELAGLPAPVDVARIARTHDRSETVNKHLLHVHAWLTELIDVWTTPD